MGADEELDVEALFERLQPVADQAGAGIGLAGGKRLDQRLAAGTLVEQLDVEIVLGVDALGHAEAERGMAGRHLRPGQADLRRRRCDGRREDPATDGPEGGEGTGCSGQLECLAARESGKSGHGFHPWPAAWG